MDEVLKYAVEHGMIDVSYIREQVDMNKREEIFRKHKGSIWQGKNHYWYTKLPCGDKKKLVKKNTYEKIKDAVIEYYSDIEQNTFSNRFDDWVKRQQARGLSDNTIYKYVTDYKRFFSGDKIENMNIKCITDDVICEYLVRLLTNKEVHWRALRGLFGYIKGVFDTACKDKLIDVNPCKYVDLKLYMKYCMDEKPKNIKERTLSKDELDALKEKTHDTKKRTITRLAVEFAMYVGMRVGEIPALRWEDIDFEQNIIIVSHSEKYNRLTKKYSIEKTKNGRERIIPITEEVREILFRIKAFEIVSGTLGEYVFMTEHGRLHSQPISNCARNLTMTKEFSNAKSIHAIRRTLNSNMRCNGVPDVVAASMMGHTARVNNMNYTYDVSDNDMKREFLRQAY